MKSRRRRQVFVVALVGASVISQTGMFLLAALAGGDAVVAIAALFLFGASVNLIVFRAYLRALRRRR